MIVICLYFTPDARGSFKQHGQYIIVIKDQVGVRLLALQLTLGFEHTHTPLQNKIQTLGHKMFPEYLCDPLLSRWG